MKKVTKKAFGILALVVLSVPAQAGWLSNLGQRIVNGAANTVQTNISGKVNKAVNDVMDGKVQTQNNETKKSNSKAAKSGNVNSKTLNATSEEYLDTKITSTTKRGKALPITGKYEEIDAGIFRFRAEPIYDKELRIGQTKIEIDEYLNPGYYAIWVNPSSRTYSVSTMYEHEEKGLEWGFGIKTIKRIFNNGPYNMLGNKEGLLHIVEVLPNTQGHLELTVVNSPERMGTAEVMVYHIQGPNLEIIK